jgi:hypothetical protein
VAIENDRGRNKRSTEEINEHIEKLFLTVKTHERVNQELESKIARVESSSNILEQNVIKLKNLWIKCHMLLMKR